MLRREIIGGQKGGASTFYKIDPGVVEAPTPPVARLNLVEHKGLIAPGDGPAPEAVGVVLGVIDKLTVRRKTKRAKIVVQRRF